MLHCKWDGLSLHLFRRLGIEQRVEGRGQVLERMRLLDGSLGQYELLKEHMVENGLWERFSIHRRTEMDQAHNLVRTMRAGDHQLVGELSGNPPEFLLVPGS